MKTFSLTKEINYEKLMHSIRRVAANLGLIAAGSIVYAMGINGVLIPKGFLSGGVVGLAILIHYLLPFTAVGLVYLVLNVPLIFLGWTHISRRFVLYSFFGLLFFSASLSIIHPPVPDISDPILAAILAGVICGTGA
ncbi:MAG: YitT family protein, partial [Thermodesulfobacteriota bacterium]|nr:YitT family protein [Thermodesulfobacteriota bacterium]